MLDISFRIKIKVSKDKKPLESKAKNHALEQPIKDIFPYVDP